MNHLSPTDAAAYLSLSTDTVYRLVRAGALPAVRVSPGRLAIDGDALAAYVDRRRLRVAAGVSTAAVEVKAPAPNRRKGAA